MAFICPKQDELQKKQATLNAIADIALELKKEFENIYCESMSAPPKCCACCSPVQNVQKPQEICEPPNVMVCYKVGKAKNSTKTTSKKIPSRTNEGQNVIRLKQSKSRELRAGVMYVGCDCEKRNGLQDDCQRTECHGSPECLITPYPVCGPSEFSNGKHLGRPYPQIGTSTVSGGTYGAGGIGPSYGNSQQNRPDNMDMADYLEYEYQCFPGIERTDDGDACICKHSGNVSVHSQNTDASYDNYEPTEEAYEWNCENCPECIQNIKPRINRQHRCPCNVTGRATYWCRFCNRSLPFG